MIKPITSNEQPKFEGIVWDEYVFARIEDNYSVVDREEMQIMECRYSAEALWRRQGSLTVLPFFTLNINAGLADGHGHAKTQR